MRSRWLNINIIGSNILLLLLLSRENFFYLFILIFLSFLLFISLKLFLQPLPITRFIWFFFLIISLEIINQPTNQRTFYLLAYLNLHLFHWSLIDFFFLLFTAYIPPFHYWQLLIDNCQFHISLLPAHPAPTPRNIYPPVPVSLCVYYCKILTPLIIIIIIF